jgi:hypothetical protein
MGNDRIEVAEGAGGAGGRPPAGRIEVERTITAAPSAIFAVLCDPQGHVAIDSSGMLQSADGEPVGAVGDSFVVHMDREALNDYPLGKYDVTVQISAFEPDREIAWTILSVLQPPIGHVYGYRLEVAEGAGGAEGRPPADSAAPDGEQTKVTSYYDWSDIHPQWREAGIFPILSEGALRATLGILDRTVRRGYPRP